jgi:hypothetical protein
MFQGTLASIKKGKCLEFEYLGTLVQVRSPEATKELKSKADIAF